MRNIRILVSRFDILWLLWKNLSPATFRSCIFFSFLFEGKNAVKCYIISKELVRLLTFQSTHVHIITVIERSMSTVTNGIRVINLRWFAYKPLGQRTNTTHLLVERLCHSNHSNFHGISAAGRKTV